MFGDFFKQLTGEHTAEFVFFLSASVSSLDREKWKNYVWNVNFLTYRRLDITEGLKSLRCRTLIFVGDSSPFHSEALHMTSKLDRRYSALVEVCGNLFLYFILAIIYVCVDMQSGRTCLMLWLGFVVGGAGPGLWIDGHRGAATCNVDTHGVLLHGVWSV